MWEYRYVGAPSHEASDDIHFDTAVDHRDVGHGVLGGHIQGLLGGHLRHQVRGHRVVELGRARAFHEYTALGGALLPQVLHDFTGVHTSDRSDTFTLAPVAQGLHSGPVRVLRSVVSNDYTGDLYVGRLEVLEQVVLVARLHRGHTVVTNQRLCEHQDLTTVRGISHRLRVPNERSGEHGFTTDRLIGTKGIT